MTNKEMNLRVFEEKVIPHAMFQPRLEPWSEYRRAWRPESRD